MTSRNARSEAGVSSVVSAVLLVALFTTAMTIWTFTTLPTWVAEREANHLGEAQEAFGRLKGDLESLAAQDSQGPAAMSIDLGPSKVPLLQGTAARGTLSFEDGFAIQAGFTNAFLHLQDGTAVGIPDELAGGSAVTDIQTLQALSLSLTSTGVSSAGQEVWVQAVVSDGASTVTARFTHAFGATGCSQTSIGISFQVTSPAGTRSAPWLCELDSGLTDYPFDLLAQPVFTSALRELEGDLTLTVTDDDPGAVSAGWGEYAAVWTDTSGNDHAIGAGSASSYTLDEEGGRVIFDPRYQRFPNQVIAFEGGAIIAAQGTGHAMRSDPGFEIGVEGGVGSLRWTIVDLEGSGSRSGSDSVTASIRNDGASDLLLEVTGATFTIDSEYAPAWHQLFDDSILISASEDAAAATLGAAGDTATLTLATGGATGVTTWIIRLHVIDATVTIG